MKKYLRCLAFVFSCAFANCTVAKGTIPPLPAKFSHLWIVGSDYVGNDMPLDELPMTRYFFAELNAKSNVKVVYIGKGAEDVKMKFDVLTDDKVTLMPILHFDNERNCMRTSYTILRNGQEPVDGFVSTPAITPAYPKEQDDACVRRHAQELYQALAKKGL